MMTAAEPDRNEMLAIPAESSTDLPKLSDLPKELGVLLASVGVLGVVLPGIAGAPALIAGGLVLWPKTFGKVENWFRGRYPETHRASMRQVGRYLDDLGRRYPHSQEDDPTLPLSNESGGFDG
jgi:hypothetical protein